MMIVIFGTVTVKLWLSLLLAFYRDFEVSELVNVLSFRLLSYNSYAVTETVLTDSDWSIILVARINRLANNPKIQLDNL